MNSIEKYSENIKENTNIHFMPFKIQYDGEAKVEKYFNKALIKNLDGSLSNSFRGRPLNGTTIDLVKMGLNGYVVGQPTNRSENKIENNGENQIDNENDQLKVNQMSETKNEDKKVEVSADETSKHSEVKEENKKEINNYEVCYKFNEFSYWKYDDVCFNGEDSISNKISKYFLYSEGVNKPIIDL